MYTYLLLNLACIGFPLLWSFERRISFYKKWNSLFPAIAIVAALFIIWDVYFTERGIWEFNENYVLGIYVAGLPIEEWMFFVCIPYACVFIYENVKLLSDRATASKFALALTYAITLCLCLLFAVLLFSNTDKLYTCVTLSLTIALLVFYLLSGDLKRLQPFYLAYILHLVPFFIVNGILTSYPVVIYNDNENLGVRLSTIPVEDTVYSFLLFLGNVTLYEHFKSTFRKA